MTALRQAAYDPQRLLGVHHGVGSERRSADGLMREVLMLHRKIRLQRCGPPRTIA